jgi:hypothetical protein
MKNKVIILGAVALAAFTISASAGTTFNSPRGFENQPRIVTNLTAAPMITVDYVTPGTGLFSPRAQGNQVTISQGVIHDRNPALACRNLMIDSPQKVAVCAQSTTMPGCTAIAPMK